MIYEFEGRTEKEAIDKAALELGLERDGFDVEIIEAQKGGLFKKGYVKIRVHTNTASQHDSGISVKKTEKTNRRSESHSPQAPPIKTDGEFEKAMASHLEKILRLMEIDGSVNLIFREDLKLGFRIDSPESPIIIGKKGKTLDALQLLANIYSGRLGQDDLRIVLDCENYRVRHEEFLVRLAYNVADRVRKNRVSILLEPLNPYDRRLIHTTLNAVDDIETKSEGEGQYRQVRVFYKGSRR